MSGWCSITSYGALSGLGVLQPYLMATADDLATALQQCAIADFNDWLVRPMLQHADSVLTACVLYWLEC